MPDQSGDPGRHITQKSPTEPSPHTSVRWELGEALVVVLSPHAGSGGIAMPITKIKGKRGVRNHVYSARSRPAAGPCTISTSTMNLAIQTYFTVTT